MSKAPLFEVVNLKARVAGKDILNGVHLSLGPGEVHAIMGSNGSGKTSLANVIMGHPSYEVLEGEMKLNGEDLADLSPDERARKGLFLAFQNPIAVPGVTVANFLRASLRSVRGDLSAREIRKEIKAKCEELEIPDAFMTRHLNDGFSGGERKRLETLQLRLLNPKVAVLDETDSGLDIDALRKVSDHIESMRSPDRCLLLITHYQRMLDYIKPDYVHIFLNGQVVHSGGAELALELERKGYDWLREEGAGAR